MFIATLSTIAKTGKQPKYMSIDRSMDKEDLTEHYSAMKKNELMPFAATWMQLEMIILSEVSQTEKDKHYKIPHMFNLKYNTNEHIYETETHRPGEQTCRCRGERSTGWGMDLEFGTNSYKLLHIEWINNKRAIFNIL